MFDTKYIIYPKRALQRGIIGNRSNQGGEYTLLIPSEVLIIRTNFRKEKKKKMPSLCCMGKWEVVTKL